MGRVFCNPILMDSMHNIPSGKRVRNKIRTPRAWSPALENCVPRGGEVPVDRAASLSTRSVLKVVEFGSCLSSSCVEQELSPELLAGSILV